MVSIVKSLLEVKKHRSNNHTIIQWRLDFFSEVTVGHLSWVVCSEAKLHWMHGKQTSIQLISDLHSINFSVILDAVGNKTPIITRKLRISTFQYRNNNRWLPSKCWTASCQRLQNGKVTCFYCAFMHFPTLHSSEAFPDDRSCVSTGTRIWNAFRNHDNVCNSSSEKCD